jgi:hypothetical protein
MPSSEDWLIGRVALDSASIAIVDPVYVAESQAKWPEWNRELLGHVTGHGYPVGEDRPQERGAPC